MRDKTKRNLVLLGAGVVCVALLVGISMRFQTPPPKEDVLPPVSSSIPEANPQPIDTDPKVTPKPIDVSGSDSGSTENKEDDSAPASQVPNQTDQPEQQIQPDVVKPTPPPKDALPADGSTPEIVDHDAVVTPPPGSTSSGSSSEPQHGDSKDGMIYVDGFGWIKDEGGGGEGTTADDMYENGNKIGVMG